MHVRADQVADPAADEIETLPEPARLLSPEDREALAEAKRLLERSSIAEKLTSMFGTPIEKAFAALPPIVSAKVNLVTRKALTGALRAAVTTMGKRTQPASPRWHKAAVVAAGAAGGVFGLAGLAVELPASTAIMLRSIADIARANGEDLSSPEARMACLEVFALGAHSETGRSIAYFGVRDTLAKQMAAALSVIAQPGFTLNVVPPAVASLISQVAARFSIPVSQKLALEALPLIGAAGGAAVNYLFIDHFQDVARGHFSVRRLERLYGSEVVRALYQTL